MTENSELTRAEFGQSLEQVLKEWPDLIDVTEGAITGVDAGRFRKLEEIHYRIQDLLIESNLEDLIDLNWALFTVMHMYARASTKIYKQHVRKEMVKYIFDRNRST